MQRPVRSGAADSSNRTSDRGRRPARRSAQPRHLAHCEHSVHAPCIGMLGAGRSPTASHWAIGRSAAKRKDGSAAPGPGHGHVIPRRRALSRCRPTARCTRCGTQNAEHTVRIRLDVAAQRQVLSVIVLVVVISEWYEWAKAPFRRVRGRDEVIAAARTRTPGYVGACGALQRTLRAVHPRAARPDSREPTPYTPSTGPWHDRSCRTQATGNRQRR